MIARTTISGVIGGLSAQPLALALVVINVLFLAGGIYVLHAMAQSNQRWLAALTQACKGASP